MHTFIHSWLYRFAQQWNILTFACIFTDDNLKVLCQEVLELLKGVVELDFFTQTYADVQRSRQEKRLQRKRQNALEVKFVFHLYRLLSIFLSCQQVSSGAQIYTTGLGGLFEVYFYCQVLGLTPTCWVSQGFKG